MMPATIILGQSSRRCTSCTAMCHLGNAPTHACMYCTMPCLSSRSACALYTIPLPLAHVWTIYTVAQRYRLCCTVAPPCALRSPPIPRCVQPYSMHYLYRQMRRIRLTLSLTDSISPKKNGLLFSTRWAGKAHPEKNLPVSDKASPRRSLMKKY